MKTGRDKAFWLIGILPILLIVVITFSPSVTAPIILGFPFLLFFPGYGFIAGLFSRKGGLGGVERLIPSFGLSIAVLILATSGLVWSTEKSLIRKKDSGHNLMYGCLSCEGRA